MVTNVPTTNMVNYTNITNIYTDKRTSSLSLTPPTMIIVFRMYRVEKLQGQIPKVKYFLGVLFVKGTDLTFCCLTPKDLPEFRGQLLSQGSHPLKAEVLQLQILQLKVLQEGH